MAGDSVVLYTRGHLSTARSDTRLDFSESAKKAIDDQMALKIAELAQSQEEMAEAIRARDLAPPELFAWSSHCRETHS